MDEELDPQALAEIDEELRSELERVQSEMRTLTLQHKRAIALKRVFGGDPLTRDRFNMLHANIDEYPGKMAELRENERLLSRWVARCAQLRESNAA
jgi:hypothetical protein